ncbi:hypothetical protein SODALDRAFT_363579 [Sodiomyces alkalinus F11]|uniref:Uncharacterized protein n=1 Tax=Sodiomyces alkalinus (strain CBS 110278 / VKM F-3762 / F11) TaxID=1314773 RepID=A0A3N2PKE1_SODAK|nr:hypothetical protein SODALDRAFT_363579 [Sodiomyces alkalinus F11]ROT34890.1 hypothetical protein SODALDRAFT_363579 [Sodiomyces alkalinus F11]
MFYQARPRSNGMSRAAASLVVPCVHQTIIALHGHTPSVSVDLFSPPCVPAERLCLIRRRHYELRPHFFGYWDKTPRTRAVLGVTPAGGEENEQVWFCPLHRNGGLLKTQNSGLSLNVGQESLVHLTSVGGRFACQKLWLLIGLNAYLDIDQFGELPRATSRELNHLRATRVQHHDISRWRMDAGKYGTDTDT